MDYLQNVMGYFDQQQPLCAQHDKISKDLYQEYGVKAGLRDENGKGVLAGLTNISDIRAFEYVDGVKRPADGQLLYRGYDVKDLINGSRGSRFAFEEAGYLLLFGELPTPEKLEEFCRVLGECRTMPTNFTRDVIMKAPSHDIMNSMARSVLTLASYDPKVSDLSIPNVLRQSIQLASIFPMLAVYAYHAYDHYEKDGSMYIHRPDPQLSTAENFLRMLRPDMQYTPLEARVLDVALLLHAEHGGGNNSTFTTRVVTSSGTDTYSAMAAALCSLKGPRHGGANLMVMQMMQNIRRYKGCCAEPVALPGETIVYDAFPGMTAPRDCDGYQTHYADDSGRNEIRRVTVCDNGDTITFTAACAAPITACDYHSTWMRLFLAVDNDENVPQCCGAAYLVNGYPFSDQLTSFAVCREPSRTIEEDTFRICAQVPYQLDANRLTVTVPKALFGISQGDYRLRFKWADARTEITRWEEFYTQGCCAPIGRLFFPFACRAC